MDVTILFTPHSAFHENFTLHVKVNSYLDVFHQKDQDPFCTMFLSPSPEALQYWDTDQNTIITY